MQRSVPCCIWTVTRVEMGKVRHSGKSVYQKDAGLQSEFFKERSAGTCSTRSPPIPMLCRTP